MENTSDKYFVMVTQARAPDHIICTLSGQLWASSFSEAEIEVGTYRNYLNAGHTGTISDEFYIAVAYNKEQAQEHKDFNRFKDNRVTREAMNAKEHGQMGRIADVDNRNDGPSIFGSKGLL